MFGSFLIATATTSVSEFLDSRESDESPESGVEALDKEVRNRDTFVFANREQAVDRRFFGQDKASIILNFSSNITRLFARLALFFLNCYHRSLSGTDFQKQRPHRREPLPDYGLVSIGV